MKLKSIFLAVLIASATSVGAQSFLDSYIDSVMDRAIEYAAGVVGESPDSEIMRATRDVAAAGIDPRANYQDLSRATDRYVESVIADTDRETQRRVAASPPPPGRPTSRQSSSFREYVRNSRHVALDTLIYIPERNFRFIVGQLGGSDRSFVESKYVREHSDFLRTGSGTPVGYYYVLQDGFRDEAEIERLIEVMTSVNHHVYELHLHADPVLGDDLTIAVDMRTHFETIAEGAGVHHISRLNDRLRINGTHFVVPLTVVSTGVFDPPVTGISIIPVLPVPLHSPIRDAASIPGYRELTPEPDYVTEYRPEGYRVPYGLMQSNASYNGGLIGAIIGAVALGASWAADDAAVAGAALGGMGGLVAGAAVGSLFGPTRFVETGRTHIPERAAENRALRQAWEAENAETTAFNDLLLSTSNAAIDAMNRDIEQHNRSRGYIIIRNLETGESHRIAAGR